MWGIINGDIILEVISGGKLGVDSLRQGRWNNMVSVFRGLKERWLFRSQMCLVLMADDKVSEVSLGVSENFR